LCNHCCSRKAINITYSECVFVALGVPHEFAFAILSSVASPFLLNFPSYKRHDFRKKNILNINCVLTFSTTFFFNEIVLILRTTQGDVVRNVHRSSFTVPVILVRL